MQYINISEDEKYKLLEQIEANIPKSEKFEDYELEILEHFSKDFG